MSRFKKLVDGYQTVANITLATLILMVLVNLALYGMILIRESGSTNPIYRRYSEDVAALYPTLEEDEVNGVLSESWSRKLQYEPYTQYRERAFQGRYVNVHDAGYRLSEAQGPWPPDERLINVVVLGGSTTFGYGVPDDWTVPSMIQEALDRGGQLDQGVRVYNFGRASYYSSLERALFVKLLMAGHVPDLLVLVDGLNEFGFADDHGLANDEPAFTEYLTQMLDLSHSRPALLAHALGYTLPIGRLGLLLQERAVDSEPEPVDAEERARAAIARYRLNKRVIETLADEFDVPTLFVWQPVSMFRYERSHDPFGEADVEHLASQGYPLMEESMRRQPLGDNFLWLADIQQGHGGGLYVDRYHYGRELSRLVGERIAEAALQRLRSAELPTPPVPERKPSAAALLE